MNTFNINQYGIYVKDDFGDTTKVEASSAHYAEAKEAVMCADWDTFYRLAETNEMDEVDIGIVGVDTSNVGIHGLIAMITGLTLGDRAEDDSPEFEAMDEFESIGDPLESIEGTLNEVKGWLEDGIISPEDLITDDNLDLFADAMPQSSEPSHEHDLSNWNGSPIFYPTREMARAQSDRWGMFWDYHDFGIASPTGYRYATVPRGIGPTAPDGYDWVCLPREE